MILPITAASLSFLGIYLVMEAQAAGDEKEEPRRGWCLHLGVLCLVLALLAVAFMAWGWFIRSAPKATSSKRALAFSEISEDEVVSELGALRP
jgi:hypothetical protein